MHLYRYLKNLNPGVLSRLSITPIHEIVTCSVVKAELFYGAMRSSNPTQTYQVQEAFISQFKSLPFEDQAALIHGRIRAQLAATGKPIGPYDLQIAAIALANDLTLVTNNTREFCRVDGLKLEDWQREG